MRIAKSGFQDRATLNQNQNSGMNLSIDFEAIEGVNAMLQSHPVHSVLVVDQIAAVFFGAVTIAAVMIEDAPEMDRIIAYCLGGSVLGSWAHILLFKVNQHRNVVAVFLGNAILAFAFSPSICEWILPVKAINLRSCMFVSASMGLCSSWIVTNVFPELGIKLLASLKFLRPKLLFAWMRSIVARLWGFQDPGK